MIVCAFNILKICSYIKINIMNLKNDVTYKYCHYIMIGKKEAAGLIIFIRLVRTEIPLTKYSQT